MDMWIYIGLFVGALLAFGAWTDWRRRGSARGSESRAERHGSGPESYITPQGDPGAGGGP